MVFGPVLLLSVTSPLPIGYTRELAAAASFALVTAWLLVPALGFWRGRTLAQADVTAAEQRREHFLESPYRC